MKIFFAAAFRFAALASVFAHAPIAMATEHSAGAWLIVVMTDRMPSSAGSGRWRYWLDSQARYADIGSGINQLLIRPGIGYDLNPAITLWAGYARFRTHGRSGSTVTEDRYWQQLNWRLLNREQSSFAVRFRLEERSLSSGSDTAVVLRTQFKYVRKLVAGSDIDLFAILEPFLDFRNTDWGADSGLNRHRLQFGAGRSLTRKSRVEIGYLNFYNHVAGAENRSDHNLTVSFRSKF